MESNSQIVGLLVFSVLVGACNDTKSAGRAAALDSSPASTLALRDTCDGPDTAIACCFVNMPTSLTSTLTMGGLDELGDPLLISGILLHADGKTPYAGVILYTYQTDHTGRYTKKGNERGVQRWHGRLHGWAKSDEQGRYVIRTIRPTPYPSRTDPAHIHAAIQEPGGRSPYYIPDFVFKDDPLVTPQYLASVPAVGGNGIVDLQRTATRWTGRRDIILK